MTRPSKLLVGLVLAGWAGHTGLAIADKGPVVIELTQVSCQIIESENAVDQQFAATTPVECERINAATAADRLANAPVLTLKPGKTIFRVTNRNVNYQLGFFVRGDGLANRSRLPRVSGGGLTAGKTKDYVIDLKPGEYIYSCPLNPTPDYKLIVAI